MEDFRQLCGLPNVHDAINGTRIQISKPKTIFLKDYYCHKTRGQSIVAQTIVDSKNKFLNIYVGLQGSINDYEVLCKFALYKHAQNQGLFDPRKGVNGFPPYLLGDKGYRLIIWIMTPFKHYYKMWLQFTSPGSLDQ